MPLDELIARYVATKCLSCFCPAVAMMETAEAGLRVDLACSGQGLFNCAMGRCGLLQRDMSSVLVIVRKIFTSKPSEIVFVQRNDVISQLPASTADPPFRVVSAILCKRRSG